MAVSSFWHFVLLAFLLVNLSKAQPSAPVPHLLTYADAVLAPAPGQEDYEAKTYSEGPGLDGGALAFIVTSFSSCRLLDACCVPLNC